MGEAILFREHQLLHSLTQPCELKSHSAEVGKRALIYPDFASTASALINLKKHGGRLMIHTRVITLGMCIATKRRAYFLKKKTLRPITPFLWLHQLYKLFLEISIVYSHLFINFCNFSNTTNFILVDLCKKTKEYFVNVPKS